MAGINLLEELATHKNKSEKDAERVLSEVNRILNQELFTEKNILNNLRNYNKLSEVIDEEEVEASNIFSTSEIKEIAIKFRLRFIDSQHYKFDYPYESVLRIEYLNDFHKKNLKGFKVLGTTTFFKKKDNADNALLFAPTNHGNFYLVHNWGKPLNWQRKYLNWPIKNIENLFLTIILSTLFIAISLPTSLITYDTKIPYWSTYRIGVFFHLFIFNLGVTAYITFAFSKNLSASIWNSERDFG